MNLPKSREKNPAFFIWSKKVYAEHPIGGLLLAVYMYECCLKHSDTVTWDIMQELGCTFDSDGFLTAAMEILKS